MFPAFGALIGGAVGGPVGFVAGIKVGGMAAVGGGLIGKCGKRNKVHISLCIFLTLCWLFTLRQMRCTGNANDSTYI